MTTQPPLTSVDLYEITTRLETLHKDTHEAMNAISDFIDTQPWRVPIIISSLTWLLAGLVITTAKPGACWANVFCQAIQKIVEQETGTKCPGHPHDGHPQEPKP
jgi:hypothetical protein